jgi:hypothetical protein
MLILFLLATTEEKGSKSKSILISDATIMGSTVYNSILQTDVPIVIVKELYERKN